MNHQVTMLMYYHERGARVRHHGGKLVRVGDRKYHLKNYLDALKCLAARGDKSAMRTMLRLTTDAPVSRSARAVAANVSGKTSFFKRAADAVARAAVK